MSSKTRCMTKCIAFHSYKGGTGKTTLAANLAAALAKKGNTVVLLELDVYAPSLLTYFGRSPSKWVNDFLLGNAEVNDVLVDITSSVLNDGNHGVTKEGQEGKLYVAFCNVNKDEIYKIDGGKLDNTKMQLLRRFILLREQIITNYGADYIIIDTSPGIRYWSINALAVADLLFLTLKMGDLDIKGTKKMVSEIYNSLTDLGTKSFLVLNKVAGYCVPSPHYSDRITLIEEPSKMDGSSSLSQSTNSEIGSLDNETGLVTISSIPCYCDIQFSIKEFLTVINHPDHPFSKQIDNLAYKIQIKS